MDICSIDLKNGLISDIAKLFLYKDDNIKVLHIIDAQDFDTAWNCYKKHIIGTIIYRHNKIALVRRGKEGYYKFPE